MEDDRYPWRGSSRVQMLGQMWAGSIMLQHLLAGSDYTTGMPSGHRDEESRAKDAAGLPHRSDCDDDGAAVDQVSGHSSAVVVGAGRAWTSSQRAGQRSHRRHQYVEAGAEQVRIRRPSLRNGP